MRFYCKVCDRNFKKFVLFEGHFEFSERCRDQQVSFIECYICSQKFRHYASLKYHMQQHTIKRVTKVTSIKKAHVVPQTVRKLVIPKITLEKQWNFKTSQHATEHGQNNVPRDEELLPVSEPKIAQLVCKVCRKNFSNLFHLAQHAAEHEKVSRDEELLPSVECPAPKIAQFLCKICDSSFPSLFHLAQHATEHGKKTVSRDQESLPSVECPPPKIARFLCEICDNEFPSPFHLALHTTGHRKDEPVSSQQMDEKMECESVPEVSNAVVAVAKSTASSGNRNQCSVCKIVLKNGGDRLKRHMQFHIDGKSKCEICNIRFSRVSLGWHQRYFHKKPLAIKRKKPTLSSNRLHIKNKRMTTFENKKRRCKICNATVKVGNVTHMQNHKTGKFKCDICNIRFSQLSFVWHQKRVHPEINTRTCIICKTTLSQSRSMRKHLLVHEIGKVKCELCDIRFTPYSLLAHQKQFHPDVPRLLSVKQPCSICKVICRSRDELNKHDDMHANGEFKCEKHQIRFTFEALQTHNSRWHDKSRRTCPTCKLTVANNFHLKRHNIVHLIGGLKCEICDIPFTQNSLLHHRKVFHSELFEIFQSERQISSKTMSSAAHQRRNRIILQSKQFQCTYCKLCFHDATKLERHTVVHVTGDVECRICKIRFTKNSLLFHEKRFHREDMIKERILKAIHRHISDELQALNELESKDIPIILEDQYKQLIAENNLKNQCLICKLPCGEANKLDKHLTVHIEGDYKCEICSVWFTKNSLDFHQKRYHLELYEERISNGIKLTKEHCVDEKENEVTMKTKNNRHQCDICKVYVGGVERMDEHKQTHITGDVECKLCNIRFTTNAFRYHQKRYHPDDFISVVQVHKCTVCKLKFAEAKKLETHMTVHTEADTQCDICNIPFTAPSLRYHMRRFHTNRFTTELLQKALQRNGVETSTNALNTLNRNQCPICNINCDGKKLDVHIRVHIEGDVKCSICQTWFTQPSLDYHYKRFHPQLHVAKEDRIDVQHQCSVCKLMCYDECRMNEHMKVHRGSLKCTICDIPFTKPSLVYHFKRFHPNLTKTERIFKSIENCAPKKNLHSCSKCGKSFTRICYLNLHIKNHRNAVEPVEIPFAFDSPSGIKSEPEEVPLVDSTPLPEPEPIQPVLSPPFIVELSSDSDEMNPIVTSVKTRNYECYVCKKQFKIAHQLQDHVFKHVVYEQWIDPLSVQLSNWDPNELMEIIAEQPIVLVENLDMQTINLKLSADSEGPNENSMEKLQSTIDVNENIPEMYLQNAEIVDMDTTAPDTTNSEDVVEILSESDDDDFETIQYQLNNNAQKRPELPDPKMDTNEPVYISSDDEDNYNGDITDLFHCYFCNGRFVTLGQFGEHGNICHMKGEPEI